MDYKEKYEKALERMKSWVSGEHPECFTEAQKAAEFIFPELKESEDERIRKAIIKFLKENKDFPEDWISWLEKQGEQKPAWSEDDEKWINRACMLLDELNHLETLTLAKIPHNLDDIINHLKSLKDRLQPQQKQEWSEDDEKIIETMCKEGDLRPSQMIWLKSLKNRVQPHWKPTEEQMENLEYAINMVDKCCEDSLQSLYNDLKKL